MMLFRVVGFAIQNNTPTSYLLTMGSFRRSLVGAGFVINAE